MGKSNELGQFATLVSVDSASDNVFFGPSILPTVSIDTNAGIITSTTFSGSLTGNVTGNVTGNLTGGADLSGILKESANIVSGQNALYTNPNVDLVNGMVHVYVDIQYTNTTPNIRYDSSNSLDSKMSVGECISVTLIYRNYNSASWLAQLTIDGSAVTEYWLGGSAPSSGNAAGYDVYTYNIVKTAASTFLVFANHVNFA